MGRSSQAKSSQPKKLDIQPQADASETTQNIREDAAASFAMDIQQTQSEDGMLRFVGSVNRLFNRIAPEMAMEDANQNSSFGLFDYFNAMHHPEPEPESDTQQQQQQQQQQQEQKKKKPAVSATPVEPFDQIVICHSLSSDTGAGPMLFACPVASTPVSLHVIVTAWGDYTAHSISVLCSMTSSPATFYFESTCNFACPPKLDGVIAELIACGFVVPVVGTTPRSHLAFHLTKAFAQLNTSLISNLESARNWGFGVNFHAGRAIALALRSLYQHKLQTSSIANSSNDTSPHASSIWHSGLYLDPHSHAITMVCASPAQLLSSASAFIHKPASCMPLSAPKQPNGLRVELRPYQLNAMHWMLQRESSTRSECWCSLLWDAVPVASSCVLFRHRVSGVVVDTKPDCSCHCVRGGILADEMGLGKTVEVLALILAHPPPTSTTSTALAAASSSASTATTSNLSHPPAPSVSSHQPPAKRRKRFEDSDVTSSAHEAIVIDEDTDSDEEVLCVCGETSHDDGGVWVQCSGCSVWMHVDCVGWNPEDEGDYMCAQCVSKCCKTTLVVCPQAILQQWQSELKKHTEVGCLSVCVYEGVKFGDVTAAHLAKHDIVLTTYTVLANDLHHTNSSRQGLRNKRTLHCLSPLSQLVWWRLCVDEGQMVECPSSNIARMANRLNAINRWCVTGTPFSKVLRDLPAVLSFLKLPECLTSTRLWASVFQIINRRSGSEGEWGSSDSSTVSLLWHVARSVMWRTMKADVWDQLGIPDQRAFENDLSFSNVERYMYDKLHRECVEALFGSQKQVGMQTLLKLRQMCCHPQLAKYLGFSSVPKEVMRMDVLVRQLADKQRLVCEEAQRKMIFEANTIAGLLMLKDLAHEACLWYYEGLTISRQSQNARHTLTSTQSNNSTSEAAGSSSSASHGNSYAVDMFQQIHILHNLTISLGMAQSSPPAFSPTQTALPSLPVVPASASLLDRFQKIAESEDVPSLSAQLSKLEHEYTQEVILEVTSLDFELTSIRASLSQQGLAKKMDPLFAWISQALQAVDFGQLLERVQAELLRFAIPSRIASRRFTSVQGLLFQVLQVAQDLFALRDKTLSHTAGLSCAHRTPPHEEISLSGNCQKCRVLKFGPACARCQAMPALRKYEEHIFPVRNFNNVRNGESGIVESVPGMEGDDGNDDVDDNNDPNQPRGEQVLRVNTELEMILRHLLRMAKPSLALEVAQSGDCLLKIFDGLRKELRGMHKLFMKSHELLGRHHELMMVRQSLRIGTPDEIQSYIAARNVSSSSSSDAVNALEGSGLVPEHEVEALIFRSKTNYVNAKADLRAHTHQHEFLKQQVQSMLPSQTSAGSQQMTQAECPVCLSSPADGHWCVLPCGHLLCAHDWSLIRQRNPRAKQYRCLVCRRNVPCAAATLAHHTLDQASSSTTATATTTTTPTTTPTATTTTSIAATAAATSAASSSLPGPTNNINSDNPSGDLRQTSTAVVPMAPVQVGGWGIKIDTVLSCIVGVLTSFPEDQKILVFSQWAEMLDVVCHALSRNNIPFLRLDKSLKTDAIKGSAKPRGRGNRDTGGDNHNQTTGATINHDHDHNHDHGQYSNEADTLHLNDSDDQVTNKPAEEQAQKSEKKNSQTSTKKWRPKRKSKPHMVKALTAFKETHEIRVLLLPTQMGANGLNLVEATHVILLEPLLNRAVELQAISRVHRMGQTRQTHVHRFTITDTVEQVVRELGSTRVTKENAHPYQQRGHFVAETKMLSEADFKHLRVMLFQQLQGESVSLSIDGADVQMVSDDACASVLTPETILANNTAFWNKDVLMGERQLSRSDALEILIREHATALRVSQQVGSGVFVAIHGKSVPDAVATKLVVLNEVD